ncbi:MAG: hypothetical protein SCH71_10205 [Desulfobulbaceae bacterium]|nr:hypothetical protein [Desulfobulbaceae bacterium]
MRLFLHIGTRKTGSSLIQNFCQLNKDKLLEQGYFYPDNNNFGERKGKSAGHWRLHKIFEGRDNYTLENYLPSSFPGRNVVLSNEALTSEQCDIFNMPEKVRNFLSGKFQIIVIVYLRRQDLYVGSLYNEGIISGNHKAIWAFDEFFERNRLPELDYYALLKSWIKVFGKENIRIRPFEKGQFHEGELIRDFLHCMDLKWQNDYVVPDETSKNSSPDIILIEALRLINRIPLQLRPMYKNFMDNVFDELVFEGKYGVKSKQSLIPPAKRLEILKKYSSGNAQAAREFLERKDGKLFYDAEPRNDEHWEPVAVNNADLIIRLFSLFLEQKSLEIQDYFSSLDSRMIIHQNRIETCDNQIKRLKNNFETFSLLLEREPDVTKNKISSIADRLLNLEKKIGIYSKRISIFQCQLDSGRQTQEINNNDGEGFRKKAWQAIEAHNKSLRKMERESQLSRTFLYRNVLALYTQARKSYWKCFCRLLRFPWLREVKIVRNSDLVDSHYYFETYPHVITAGLSAAEHYVRYGAQQGLNPSAEFNTQEYLAEYPEAAHNGINPLVHFILSKKNVSGK